MLHRVFIGSSSESLSAARALKKDLSDVAEIHLWSEDVFQPSEYTLEALVRESSFTDLAILLFTPDDLSLVRDSIKDTVRDNVIFEYGLFAGRLGRRRCYFVIPRDAPELRVPSDIAGITAITYDARIFASQQSEAFREVAGTLRRILIDSRADSDDRRSLGGRWLQCWNVSGSTNYPDKNQSEATIVHMADHLRAEWTSGSDTFVLSGLVEGRIVTGTWRNRVHAAAYVGAFQLSVSTTGRRMTGRWLGHRENITEVEGGLWTWERL